MPIDKPSLTKPSPRKELLVSDLREILSTSKGAILTDYRGLTVAEVSKLRRKLREDNAEYHIVKNTLLKVAMGGEINPDLDNLLKGPTAIVFAKGDVVGPAKSVIDFVTTTRNRPDVKVKGGYIDGKVYDVAQVTALSKLPSREVIIAQFVGTLNGPAANFVGTLNSIISEFVGTLDAIAEKQGGGAEAVAA
ncbi:MAG: ribosomal protein [Chthonomonadaceae bacterium]|nr:ribosomal protein [Chthonomonadaceae bacterium]